MNYQIIIQTLNTKKEFKHCISKKVDKEEFMKKYKDIAELMKKERKKEKER